MDPCKNEKKNKNKEKDKNIQRNKLIIKGEKREKMSI
jgi:hypothetical protein